MKKYILPRYYPGGPADDYDFWLTDDREGERVYFSLELMNLPHLAYLLSEDWHFQAEVRDLAAYQNRYKALRGGDIRYFIGNLYYGEKNESGGGYEFLSVGESVLDGRTVFEVKNRNGMSPYSASIYLAETKPLTPERVTEWMEKLSLELFGTAYRFEYVPRRAGGDG
jgi:hypothetical protein